MQKFFEYSKKDLKPLESFELKDELNPDIWKKRSKTNEKIKPEIRKELLGIANEYISTIDFDIKVKDIILVGSMCNYNWSEYSDFDLHILTSYKKINKDISFVANYFDLHKKLWGMSYPISIDGYDVELFVQDVNDPNFFSMGIYSLQDDKWIQYPNKVDIKIDIKEIESKSKFLMTEIDDIEKKLKNTDSESISELDILSSKIDIVWHKIKKYRKEGLKTKESELSVGNLIFKFLRRNKYINTVISIRKKILLMKYDK